MKFRWAFVLVACAVLSTACVSTGARREATAEEAALANLSLGVGYLSGGRPDIAVEALQRAINLDPRLADAHSALAVAYDQLEDSEQAEAHHLRATQLDPGNPESQNSYAVFLCRQDRWEDAKRYFERATSSQRGPVPDATMVNAAVCARGANDLPAAEAYFRAALRANPISVDALSGMIELSYQIENFLQGRAFVQRLFAAVTPNARHLLLCYSIEAALDAMPAASDCARRLRDQFPGSQEAAQLRELERNEAG